MATSPPRLPGPPQFPPPVVSATAAGMLTPSGGTAEPRSPGCRWLGWLLARALRCVSRVSISLELIATLRGIFKMSPPTLSFCERPAGAWWWGFSWGWRGDQDQGSGSVWAEVLLIFAAAAAASSAFISPGWRIKAEHLSLPFKGVRVHAGKRARRDAGACWWNQFEPIVFKPIF